MNEFEQDIHDALVDRGIGLRLRIGTESENLLLEVVETSSFN